MAHKMAMDQLKESKAQVEGIKHPLGHPWGVWLFTNENKNWLQNQVKLANFDTVEDYWCLYHHMKLPSELRHRQDYAVFKKGISPMWEDTANKAGGRWFINMEKRASDLDRIWLDVVLLMIGENFGSSNEVVCGAVVNVRGTGKNKISLWTRTLEEKFNVAIGRKLKEQLKINLKIQFYGHNSNNVLYTC